MIKARGSHQRCSVKKSVIRNFAKFTGKHLCQIFSFNKVAGLRLQDYRPQTLAQMFFCEYCEISKNNFSYRTLSVVPSANPYLNGTGFAYKKIL